MYIKKNIFATYPEMYYRSYIHEDLPKSKRFQKREKGGGKRRGRKETECVYCVKQKLPDSRISG